MDIDNLYIASVDDVRDVQIKTVQALDEDQLALDLEAWVDMTFEAHVSPSAAHAYRGDDFKVTNYNNEDSLAEGVVQRRVLTEIWARSSQATNTASVGIDVHNFLPLGSVDPD